MTTRTVRDFKTYFTATLHERNIVHYEYLRNGTYPFNDFFAHLNRLGSIKKTKSVLECKDIDASAPLTDTEWDDLDQKFQSLLQSV